MSLLSGCALWFGEFLTGLDGNPFLELKGNIIEIKTFSIDSDLPFFELPDLSGDRKAIVAISPTEKEPGEYFVITLEDSITYSKAELLNLREKDEKVNNLQSLDYYKYEEEALPLNSGTESCEVQSFYRDFWVRDFQNLFSTSYKKVTAAKMISGQKMEIWVDNSVTVEENFLHGIINEFENRIYPSLTGSTADFGEPYLVDRPIILLITPLEHSSSQADLMGYFDEVNYYNDEHSNYENMIYLNYNVLSRYPANIIYGNIAHEFQHLLFFSEKLAFINTTRWYYDDLWINEGLSVLASHITGYLNLEDDWRIFDSTYGYFSHPAKYSLTEWNKTPIYAHYGSAGLFAFYLYERFGSGIIPAITQTERDIEDAISNYSGLSEKNRTGFDIIVSDWMTANMVDGFYNIPDNRYRYKGLSLSRVPEYRELTGIDSVGINKHAVRYYLIEEGQGLWFKIKSINSFNNEQPIPEFNVSLILFE